MLALFLTPPPLLPSSLLSYSSTPSLSGAMGYAVAVGYDSDLFSPYRCSTCAFVQCICKQSYLK